MLVNFKKYLEDKFSLAIIGTSHELLELLRIEMPTDLWLDQIMLSVHGQLPTSTSVSFPAA